MNFLFVKRSVVDRIPALQWKNNISKLCSKFIVNGYTELFVNHVPSVLENKHLFVKGSKAFVGGRQKYLFGFTDKFDYMYGLEDIT